MAKKKVKIPDFDKDFVKKRNMSADNIGGIKKPPKNLPKKLKNSGLSTDSFANFTARLGIQTNNISSQGYYNLGPFITRNRLELEAAYRDSWVVGKAVDCIAEDMTRDGITMYSEMKPKEVQELQVAISEFGIWHDIGSAIKWGRLYGGCLAVIMTDGANYEKPLNIEAIGEGSFKGLVVLDRWMVQPSMGELITELGKDIGKPKYYQALPGSSVFPSVKIHHSRCLRFDGIELPYYQKLFENLWGLSVVERMLDRLMAFDSATQGAAQLLYKSHLRVIGIKGFRDALAMGGKTEDAVIKNFQYIKLMQTNEGLTVLDAEDTFNIHTQSMAGMSDALIQFGQQISGATEIPLVRLFGQSPSGFSTGDTDLRNYYDHVYKLQENQIRHQLDKLLAVMSMSVLKSALPDDFEFKFVPLWQMSEKEKSEIASADALTIGNALQATLITKKIAMKELLQGSRVTGRFTNITQEDIDAAEDEPPPAAPPAPGEEALPTEEAPPAEGETEEAEDPNERLGSANPEEETKDVGRSSVRDIFKNWMDSLKRVRQSLDAAFKEEEHPRGKGEKGGQFVSKGESGGSTSTEAKPKSKAKEKKPKEPMLEVKIVNGEKKGADGKALPKHIASRRIPPAWTNVQYSPDPKADMQVKGRDSKNRPVALYTDEHWVKAAESKFAKVSELNVKFDSIAKENQNNFKGDAAERALVLKVIMHTGIRPEKDIDTKSEKKAYGATTLEGKHVVTNKDGTVTLSFVGKKGVQNNYTVRDKELVKTLIDRANKAGKNGRIFDCNYNPLLKYTSSLDGGGFTPKDFRTLIGTKTAIDEIKKVKELPTNEKEYKKAVVEIAKRVSEKLCNTPKECLKSYINPAVFSQWRVA